MSMGASSREAQVIEQDQFDEQMDAARKTRLNPTLAYILRRLGLFLVLIWGALTLTFVFIRLIPGNPIDALVTQMEIQGQYGGVDTSTQIVEFYEEEFGLNGSIPEQYVSYLNRVIIHQDFGPSLVSYPVPATELIARALPWTIFLVGMSVIMGWLFGVVAGCAVGWARKSRWSGWVTNFCLVTANIPDYFFALWFVFIFAYALDWFPANGAYDASLRPGFTWPFISSMFYYAALPIASSVLVRATDWLISTRSLVVNILGEDYLTYAQARGLKNKNILTRIVMRNTWLPQIAGLGISLGGIVGGNILIENLFRYPGIGTLMVEATALKDVNTMMACLSMMIILVLSANLIIDLLLPIIDPRVRRS